MARCVKIPVHIIKSSISASAKLLWMELSLLSSPKRPLIMLHPETMAEKMGRSKRTIARLILELEAETKRIFLESKDETEFNRKIIQLLKDHEQMKLGFIKPPISSWFEYGGSA